MRGGVMVTKKVFWVCFCVTLVLGCAGGYEGRLETIRAQHPQWDGDTQRKVASRSVEPGMTREMVKAALGTAESVSKQGDEEEWGYAYFQDTSLGPVRQIFVYWVYFRGDVVVRTRGDTSKLQTIY
jgi:outer membrane protein assembly factor BamE (lipoprotein component of BamABCDE complex)